MSVRGGRRPDGQRDDRPRGRSGLAAIFAPRPSVDVGMPSIRSSLARGFTAMLAVPLFVVGVPAILIGGWLVLVALGFQGPFVILIHTFALPPLGTSTDVSVATTTFPVTWVVPLVALVVVRGVLIAAMAGGAVQVLRRGRVDRFAWVPMLRALPTSILVSFVALSGLFTAQLLGTFLGGSSGLGLFVQLAVLILGVSYLGFAPAIAAEEGRRVSDALLRGVRAARIPGAGNLSLATLYVIPSIALLFTAPALPGGEVGVNPSVGAWLLVLITNLVHVAIAATYAYRYLSISDAVPEPARAAARSRRR